MRVLLIWSLVLTGCYTQIETASYLPHRKAPIFGAESLSSKDEIIYPDSGFYYRFNSMSDLSPIEDIELMLRDLYSRGFNVTRAWYRAPGSHNRTIMSALLMVHLTERNPDMDRFNFVEIAKPRGGRGVGMTTIYVPLN